MTERNLRSEAYKQERPTFVATKFSFSFVRLIASTVSKRLQLFNYFAFCLQPLAQWSKPCEGVSHKGNPLPQHRFISTCHAGRDGILRCRKRTILELSGRKRSQAGFIFWFSLISFKNTAQSLELLFFLHFFLFLCLNSLTKRWKDLGRGICAVTHVPYSLVLRFEGAVAPWITSIVAKPLVRFLSASASLILQLKV